MLILCYHAVSSDWHCELAVEPRQLERQLSFFLRRGYEPRTLAEAIGRTGAGKSLVVTFDDAYRSVLLEGLPVLSRLGVPGTVFVPTEIATGRGLMTDFIPMPAGWIEAEEELRCMSWDELRLLAESGWEIGSHTRSHPDLTECAGERAADELRESRRACEEEMQRECRLLAYPFGAHDERVVRLARQAGYEAAVTLGKRLLGSLRAPSALELPRDGIYRSTPRWQLAAIASPPLRGMRSLAPAR